jgi:hypothetical protein
METEKLAILSEVFRPQLLPHNRGEKFRNINPTGPRTLPSIYTEYIFNNFTFCSPCILVIVFTHLTNDCTIIIN